MTYYHIIYCTVLYSTKPVKTSRGPREEVKGAAAVKGLANCERQRHYRGRVGFHSPPSASADLNKPFVCVCVCVSVGLSQFEDWSLVGS